MQGAHELLSGSDRAGSHPFANIDYQRHIPNYRDSIDVERVDAGTLDRRTFLREFVDRNRPCLIKGAARHWAACSKWQSIDYLKSLCGDVEIPVFDSPRPEGDVFGITPDKKEALRKLSEKPVVKVRFADFLDRAMSDDFAPEALYFLYHVAMVQGGPFERLAADIDTFRFLPHPKLSGHSIYQKYACFFYRSSLTDWHYHVTAEALQTQVMGIKEVLLLPPSETVWSYMRAVQLQSVHSYDADLTAFPQAARVLPLRAVLHPGDSLYIPNYWWHLVSTRGNTSLGATVPTWWDAPFHVQMDLRYPAARQCVTTLLKGALPLRFKAFWLPALAGGVVWSKARQWVRTQDEPWFLRNERLKPVAMGGEPPRP